MDPHIPFSISLESKTDGMYKDHRSSVAKILASKNVSEMTYFLCQMGSKILITTRTLYSHCSAVQFSRGHVNGRLGSPCGKHELDMQEHLVTTHVKIRPQHVKQVNKQDMA